MLELLNNAWNGWGNFIFYGKYPALLLLVLVVFWFFSDRKKEPVLLGYATVITVCCMFPPTAALLMQYQKVLTSFCNRHCFLQEEQYEGTWPAKFTC